MSQAVTVNPSRALTQMRRALSLSSFPIGVLTLGIPIYAPDKLGVSATQVGDLISVYALMTLLMRPFIGPAMDRWGRRRFFIAGLALQMASNLFFAAGASYDWLLWGRIVQGVAAGMLWISAYAITADLAAQGKQGNLFGSVEEMLARGGLYGAVIGAPILLFTNFNQTAWSLLFVLYAVLNAFGLAVAIRDVPETWQRASGTPTPPLLDGTQLNWLKSRWRQMVIDLPRPLLLLAFIVVFTSTANAGLSPILIQFVRENITPIPVILALAYLPSALVFAFFQSRLGKVSDRIGRRLPIAIGLLVSGLSSAIVPNLSPLKEYIGLWVLLPIVAFWVSEAIAFSAATPAEQALVADLASEKSRGKAFGVYTTAQSLGQVIGPSLSGRLYDGIAHSAPFYFNTVVLWGGAAIVLLLIQEPLRHAVMAPVPHEPPSQWPSAGGGK